MTTPVSTARPALDRDALRAATPGAALVTHFNHAGASLMSSATLAAMTEHLHREALNGPHEAAALVANQLEALRRDAATLIGAKPSEIAFTASGSTGWGLAFAALPPLRPGERLLVGRQEWGGNLATMHAAAERAGAVVETIPCREDGSVDPEALQRMLDDRVRLVSLTWLPANGGLVNDAAAVGRATRRAGVPFFIDAGQALGHVPVDVGELGCDVLKGAGRKHLRGPRGTAVLFVRDGFRERLRPAFFDVLSAPWSGHKPAPRLDARVLETSEAPVALLLGLGVAIREALDIGVDRIWTSVQATAESLRARLRAVPGVTLRDLGDVRSGIVSFTIDGLDVGDVQARLARQRINVGANGVAYTPLDMQARGLTGIVRASVSYLTDAAELDRLTTAVRAAAAERSQPLPMEA